MKKTFFSITLVTVMAASGVVHALPVGETTARAAAVNWFAQVSGRDSPVLDEFIAVRGDAGGVYFVGNFSGGGFVLVAGDDAAGPILAYSKESSFVTPPESPAVAYWMSFYARELDKAAAARLVDPLKKRVWNLVVSGQRSLLQRSVSRVEPLVNAMWGQGTYFNAMCPRDDL
ncbi:MAG: Spi family protease inhibitor, partial [Myxococcota bacterium]